MARAPFTAGTLAARAVAGACPGRPFTQTLLVQPNLEVIVYRQALTPGLIARLSRFAVWKSFGSACTLQLEAGPVYRAWSTGSALK